MGYHWQASITGPVGSPYEGGVFYLYLKVPMLYPFRPPEGRFLTKIFHPNVNRHGDIGINSIQSLLTDPYCDVCMEPEVGQLCRADRDTFNAVAREGPGALLCTMLSFAVKLKWGQGLR